MVPVPVAPDDAVDFAVVLAAFSQDLVDAFGDLEAGDAVLDGGVRGGGVVPPVFAAAEIELCGIVESVVLIRKGRKRKV